MPRSPTSSPQDPEQVYRPAEDSFLLLHAVKHEVRPDDRVLEVGIGSGFVSSHLLSSCRFLVGTDCNPHAVRMSYGSGVPVIRTDLAAGLSGLFDLILFNPPYLPTDPSERINDWLEIALDGGLTGRDTIVRFLQEIPVNLAPGGRVLLLLSSLTGLPETYHIIHTTGWQCICITEERVEGGELLVVCRLIRKA